ncbi:hypothetical protein TELCIR_14047 [Teladorsagia circumcincta]|uniref:PiggyBac transposable element-derived protein domain-containing protein n=1 Tax=Teladorsagia circumcincta TaxID=45464 RepID=A0A2G9U245_TELCI|nr:hypothetical protein TELCIR_14047 [Teladorsagia circumcincta]
MRRTQTVWREYKRCLKVNHRHPRHMSAFFDDIDILERSFDELLLENDSEGLYIPDGEDALVPAIVHDDKDLDSDKSDDDEDDEAETTWRHLHFAIATTQVTFESRLYVAEAVVMELMDGYLKQGTCLYTDNWYTSLALAHQHLKKRTDLVGTLRRNRKG